MRAKIKYSFVYMLLMPQLACLCESNPEEEFLWVMFEDIIRVKYLCDQITLTMTSKQVVNIRLYVCQKH